MFNVCLCLCVCVCGGYAHVPMSHVCQLMCECIYICECVYTGMWHEYSVLTKRRETALSLWANRKIHFLNREKLFNFHLILQYFNFDEVLGQPEC